jgi:hypothetical protein
MGHFWGYCCLKGMKKHKAFTLGFWDEMGLSIMFRARTRRSRERLMFFHPLKTPFPPMHWSILGWEEEESKWFEKVWYTIGR